VASPEFPADSGREVWACIVCYEPELLSLRQLIALLEPQVKQVVVVDNSAGACSRAPADLGPSLYLPMDSNVGTAAAMNAVWRLALAGGAGFLISFDQDSRPGEGLVSCLLASHGAPSPSGRPVAAVGPVWNDARTGRPMRLLRPVRFRRRHIATPAAGLVEVDHLISSGCLISAAAYRAVGPFDEPLFLDYVDIEWSLRARSCGFATAIAAGCAMTHAIGERMVPLAGRQLAVHKPQRTYLQLRNHLLLWRAAGIPRLWLLSDLGQVVGKVLGLLVLAPDRRERLRWIARGMVDGLRGKSGPPPGTCRPAQGSQSNS
jgi:rhamnosyltransferase